MVKTHWEAVEKGAARAGRAADRSQWRVAREIYISDTTARARREALNGVLARDFDQYFLRSLPMSRMLDIMKVDVNMPDSDVTPEYLVDNVFIVGSADDVAESSTRCTRTWAGSAFCWRWGTSGSRGTSGWTP